MSLPDGEKNLAPKILFCIVRLLGITPNEDNAFTLIRPSHFSGMPISSCSSSTVTAWLFCANSRAHSKPEILPPAITTS